MAYPQTGVDELIAISDISADVYDDFIQYQTYISAKNFSDANSLLESKPALAKCIINAEKMNTIQQRIQNLQAYALSLKSQGCFTDSSATAPDWEQLKGSVWHKKTSEINDVIYCDDYVATSDGVYKKYVQNGIFSYDDETGYFECSYPIHLNSLSSDKINAGELNATILTVNGKTISQITSGSIAQNGQKLKLTIGENSSETEDLAPDLVGIDVSATRIDNAVSKIENISNATSSVAGIVKVGENISVTNGVISIDQSDVLSAIGYTPLNGTSKSNIVIKKNNVVVCDNSWIDSNIGTYSDGTVSFSSNDINLSMGINSSGVHYIESRHADSKPADFNIMNNFGGTLCLSSSQGDTGYPKVELDITNGGVELGITSGGNIRFCPREDDSVYLGNSSHRWSTVYAKKSSINTSDRNDKNSIKPLSEAYSNLFDKLIPVSYKFNDGDRVHTGFVAQDVETAMVSCGLTSMDFAGLCKDKKVKENKDGTIEEILDENGNIMYQYGLRYEEIIALCVKEIQELKKKLKEVE